MTALASFPYEVALRHLVPRPPVQFPAVFLLLHTAPLLEEEGDSRLSALVTDIPDPLRVHRPSTGAAFAAHDCPVHPIKIKVGQRAKERFQREKIP